MLGVKATWLALRPLKTIGIVRTYVAALEHPVTLAVLVNLIPITEADQSAACDILCIPKVHSKKNNDHDSRDNIIIREEARQNVGS